MAYRHKEFMETPTASITITTNGTHDVTNYATAVVNAAKPEQAKTATPTTSQQTITPDEGYALSSVTVNAMPTGSATTPATTKQQSTPTFSKSGDVITASVAATSVNVTPTVVAGYVSNGTAGTITMSANSATYTIQTETKSATTNNVTITPTDGKYLTSVSVALPTYNGEIV